MKKKYMFWVVIGVVVILFWQPLVTAWNKIKANFTKTIPPAA